MRPFLLLQTRPEDVAADDEYAGFLRATGLAERELRRIRVEARPLPELDLDAYAGILLGGSPFNASDPSASKSDVQRRVEHDLARLLDGVVARDVPFLGACYGIGMLGTHQGGVVDRTHGEPISAVRVTLTPEGRADPLLAGPPPPPRRRRQSGGGCRYRSARRSRRAGAPPVRLPPSAAPPAASSSAGRAW